MTKTMESLNVWKVIPAQAHQDVSVYRRKFRFEAYDIGAFNLLCHIHYTPIPRCGIRVVKTTPSCLGFEEEVDIYGLIKAGREYDLAPCPTEIAPYFATTLSLDELKERVGVIMDPIAIWNGWPQVLDIVSTAKGLRLESRGNYDGITYKPDEMILFIAD